MEQKSCPTCVNYFVGLVKYIHEKNINDLYLSIKELKETSIMLFLYD